MESDGLCDDFLAADGARGRPSWQGTGCPHTPVSASGVLFLLMFPDVICMFLVLLDQARWPKIHQFQSTEPCPSFVEFLEAGIFSVSQVAASPLEITLCPIMELNCFFEFHQKLTQSPKIFVDFTVDTFGRVWGGVQETEKVLFCRKEN